MACQELLQRMEPIKKKVHRNTPWEQLIYLCGKAGVNLTATFLYVFQKLPTLIQFCNNCKALIIKLVIIDCILQPRH